MTIGRSACSRVALVGQGMDGMWWDAAPCRAGWLDSSPASEHRSAWESARSSATTPLQVTCLRHEWEGGAHRSIPNQAHQQAGQDGARHACGFGEQGKAVWVVRSVTRTKCPCLAVACCSGLAPMPCQRPQVRCPVRRWQPTQPFFQRLVQKGGDHQERN